MITASLVSVFQDAVDLVSIADAVVSRLATAFVAIAIPTIITVAIWFIRGLVRVKELAESTSTTLTGPMGVVKEIERIRTNQHRTNGLLTVHVGKLAEVENNVKTIEKDIIDIKKSIESRREDRRKDDS